jgi:plasmid stabilization system protein ParE
MPSKKYRLKLSENARGQIHRLTDYLIERAGAQTAFDVIDELLAGMDKLEDMPYLGSPHPDHFLATEGYMALFLGRYVCVYIIHDRDIYVAGVFHQKTDWLSAFDPAP